MPLNAGAVIEQARRLHEFHEAEREQLDVVRRYWKGRQRLPALIARDAPAVVRTMARSARVNVLPIVVNSLVQSAFVDGFRATDDSDDLEVWKVWQANRMDARQSAIHRAAAAYGTAYSIVLPGDPVPVIRGASPRSLTCLYGEDPDWPMSALERLGGGLWRVFDETSLYYLERNDKGDFTFIESREHDAGVVPIVRFLDEDDLDADDEVEPESFGLDDLNTVTRGQVPPLMPIQDQIDLTTFGLHVAQHFGAFKQRYIIGWAAESEQQQLKVSAATMLTIDEDPSKINVGEFTETNLDGYIKSREASIRHAATLSQTPVHELIGDIVNLSAEALAAAEAGKDRKVGERQTLWGESHEQELTLAGRYLNVDVPDDSQVVWRDTTARSFAATVDGLGKLAQSLRIPPQELWERIPGVTKKDVERWKTTAGAAALSLPPTS